MRHDKPFWRKERIISHVSAPLSDLRNSEEGAGSWSCWSRDRLQGYDIKPTAFAATMLRFQRNILRAWTTPILESAYGASIGDAINDVTWLHDVILVTSQYSKLSHLETRSWINYPCEYCRKTRCLRFCSFGLELCEKHLAHKSALFTRSAIASPCFAA